MDGAWPQSDIKELTEEESGLTPEQMHFKQRSHLPTIHLDEAHSPFILSGANEGERNMNNLCSYLNMSQR